MAFLSAKAMGRKGANNKAVKPKSKEKPIESTTVTPKLRSTVDITEKEKKDDDRKIGSLSEVVRITHGNCIALYPSGTIIGDKCCAVWGGYKTFDDLIDACLDDEALRLELLGAYRNHGSYDVIGGMHVVSIFLVNYIFVFIFYCEEE